jgi:hypothetical protein
MQFPLSKVAGSAQTYVVALTVLVAAAVGFAKVAPARPDEENAKKLVKAMSDYLASQNALAFDFDTDLEIVSSQKQKVGLASSGAVTVNRPDKIHAIRKGGFATVDFVSDGKTVTLLDKTANAYAQVEAPGTIDQLVDVLRDKYHRPLPGADLLMSNVYDQLMPQVTDAKDLGSGVIGGVECDHLAFRTKDVDWQIWIAQGNQPRPCRYVITSTQIAGSPQYAIDVRSWKTGGQVAHDPFSLTPPADAKKLNPGDLRDFDDLPGIFAIKKGNGGH